MGDLNRLPPPAPPNQRVRAPLTALFRLVGWLWVLARHDALIPRELNPYLPGWARMVAAMAEIERSLGRPVESLFTDLGAPVAAASLAQAHPAYLADGTKVAVKVLRPGVERRVARGLDSMRLGATWVERLVPMSRRLEPRAFVETIARPPRADLGVGAGPADDRPGLLGAGRAGSRRPG